MNASHSCKLICLRSVYMTDLICQLTGEEKHDWAVSLVVLKQSRGRCTVEGRRVTWLIYKQPPPVFYPARLGFPACAATWRRLIPIWAVKSGQMKLVFIKEIHVSAVTVLRGLSLVHSPLRRILCMWLVWAGRCSSGYLSSYSSLKECLTFFVLRSACLDRIQ